MKHRLYQYLTEAGYGIEEHDEPHERIELWDDKTYLFVKSFDSIEELVAWSDRYVKT